MKILIPKRIPADEFSFHLMSDKELYEKLEWLNMKKSKLVMYGQPHQKNRSRVTGTRNSHPQREVEETLSRLQDLKKANISTDIVLEHIESFKFKVARVKNTSQNL